LLSGEELPELRAEESDRLPEESDALSDESEMLVEIEQPTAPSAASTARKPTSRRRERRGLFMQGLSGRAAHAVKRAPA
jgi:hypothetical protein